MTDSRKANFWGYISLMALLSLLALPPLLMMRYAGTRATVLLAGAVVWAVSVAVKHPLAYALSRMVAARISAGGTAAAQGFLSGVCELSAAALYFIFRPELSWTDAIAFGLGAGCAEIIYILVLGIMEGIRGRDPDADTAWLAAAECSLCVRYSVPLERFLALIGHTASRGLVYIGVSTPYSGSGLLFFALLLFAAVDGVSYYGLKANWNWNSPGLCRRFYYFVGGVSLLEATVFLLLSASIRS